MSRPCPLALKVPAGHGKEKRNFRLKVVDAEPLSESVGGANEASRIGVGNEKESNTTRKCLCIRLQLSPVTSYPRTWQRFQEICRLRPGLLLPPAKKDPLNKTSSFSYCLTAWGYWLASLGLLLLKRSRFPRSLTHFCPTPLFCGQSSWVLSICFSILALSDNVYGLCHARPGPHWNHSSCLFKEPFSSFDHVSGFVMYCN